VIDGKGLIAKMLHHGTKELDASARRHETGLSIGTAHALLVFLRLLALHGCGRVEVCAFDVLVPCQIKAVEQLHAPQDHLTLVCPRPQLGVESLAPFQVELPVIPALARRVDGARRGDDEALEGLFVNGVAF